METNNTELVKKLIHLNPFNSAISPIKLRACVGNNSGVNVYSRDCSIIDGYNDAVNILIDSILNRNATIDTIVYPLLFCCRHSIELSLKTLLKNFVVIYKKQNRLKNTDKFIESVISSSKGHDIDKLARKLQEFKLKNKEIQKALIERDYLFDFIKDYYFDINGDSFRYTFKKNLKDINLDKIRLVDVGILYKKFQILSQDLNYLINYYSFWLNSQYYKETYTKNLTRNDLEFIARNIPPYEKWGDEEFITAKEAILKKFEISNSEFSKALELIKNHYQFSAYINREIKFKNLNEETIISIAQFIKDHKNEKCNINNNEDFFKENLVEEGIKLITTLPHEDILILLTFCEFCTPCSDGNYVCEDLELIYKSLSDDFNTPDYDICKICYKFASGKIRNAFEKCGQTTYINWFDKYIQNII